MTFFTQYNWPDTRGEWNSGESIVDPSGYISPKQRIQNLIRAGERLEEFRREQYDYEHGEEDDGEWLDPMRTPGLDLADISRIQSHALDRIRRKRPVKTDPGTGEQGAENQTATGEQGSGSVGTALPEGGSNG